jgi:predicted DCC family thiol-disulfide oxidoreductase YuxK
MNTLPIGKRLILFDGYCNLCNAAVQFIIKHDIKDVFMFASLQSEVGLELQREIDIDKNIDSIILFEPPQAIYYKSLAAFKIASHLSGLFKLAILFRIFPKFITDKIYDFIAKNRYKWFGKQNNCMLPSKELKAKFLE